MRSALSRAVELVPINWRFAIPEIEHVLADSESHVLVVAPEFEDAARGALSFNPRLIFPDGNAHWATSRRLQ